MPDAIYLERGVSALKIDATVHLGNFFGALRSALEGEELYPRNNFLFIANRHYLIDFDANVDSKARTYDLIRDFLALGINPERTVVYRQSDIRELFSLMWLLSCVTPASDLLDSPEARQAVDPTLACVLSPQLMAADVLGLRATKIFVGPDEQAHVDYCRDLVGIVNRKAAMVLLPIPTTTTACQEPVPGPNGQTMSKTNKNIIPVFAPEKDIHRLFKKIPVAAVGKKEPINPDTDISFALYRLMASAEQIAALRAKYVAAEIDGPEARQIVCEQFFDYFGAARQRRSAQQLSDDAIEEILLDGQRRVRREMRNTVAILEDYLFHSFGRPGQRPRLP